jgi:hypothetical protein
MNITAVRHMTDTRLAIYKISVYTLTVHTLHVCYKRPMKDAVEKRVNIVSRHIKSTYINYQSVRGTRWRSWLRHCATNLKVAGSILDGVIGIFH